VAAHHKGAWLLEKDTLSFKNIHNQLTEESAAALWIPCVLHFITYVQIYKHEREPAFS
jgi:hypothetical protein